MITSQGSVVVTGEREVTLSVDGASVNPFSGVTLTDPTPGGTVTVTIDISAAQGKLMDGPGYTGLTSDVQYITHSPTYVDVRYTLAAGSASQVNAELDALVFTPSTYSDTMSPVTGLELNATSRQPNTGLIVGTDVNPTTTETEVRVVPTRSVTIDSGVSYSDGVFNLSGTVSAVAGIRSVEISATVGGRVRDLGAATVNADGTFDFSDVAGPRVQGFITATLTDDGGGTASAQADYSLTGGLNVGPYTGRQTNYTPDGSAVASRSLFRDTGQRAVAVDVAGQTLQSDYRDRWNNMGQPNTTFVFDPGYGQDFVNLFRVDGFDHDTLSFKGSDFGYDVAAVLNGSQDTKAGLLITDPTASSPGSVGHDKVLLTGVTKAQLTANQGDISFHG